jgi:PST family polysaccharide transporter
MVALSIMVRSMFDLHTGVLHAAGKNSEVTKSYLAYIVLLWLGNLWLLPRFGLWGYGYAELLTILSCWSLHRSLAKLYGSPDYRAALWLTAAAMAPVLLGNLINPLAGVVGFGLSYGVVFWIPAVRSILQELWHKLRPG